MTASPYPPTVSREGLSASLLTAVFTSEDLAGVYKDLAETVGVENAYKIYSHFKGLQLMFPLKFYSKTYIMQQICSEYNGKNVHALARKYGYSESRVRQILREAKDEIV